MIQKIIHYCWFGAGPKSPLVKECITSWKHLLPDYEIIEWNESNCNFDSCQFLKEAFENKKWAFVADYIRIEKLNEFGGIYLDTDVLLLKNLDEFLELPGFLGAENTKSINGAIMGFQSNHPFLRKLLNVYKQIQRIDWKNLEPLLIPYIITSNVSLEEDFSIKDMVITDNIRIYPSEYFYPLPFDRRVDRWNYRKFLTDNSYTVHLWESSWIDAPSEFYYIQNRQYFNAFKKILKELKTGKKRLTKRYLKKLAFTIYNQKNY